MRFTLLLATFLSLSVLAVAQRGGGHASFGGGHIASGPRGGSFTSNHFSPTPPWGAGGTWGASVPWATTNNFGRTGGRIGNYGRIGHDRGTSRYYREIPYLWGLYPNYYDPFLFGDSGYYDQPNNYGQYPEPNPSGAGYGSDPQTAYLTAQVQQLSDQLNAVEQQSAQPPVAQQTAPAPPPAPPITLVLKDGRHLQVQNYAVMDQTFWDFTSQPVKKIPLANIDIAASQRLSVANGAEFPNLTVSNGSAQ